MSTHSEVKARVAATYNAASDAYDAPENSFWSRYGARTVERLQLQPGMRVLDVCAGSGASAIPAAEAVGPAGRVVAVDIADELLERLRAKAASRGLRQLDARAGDLLHLDQGEAAFDAVICVFGIFFVTDMPEAIRQLWRAVAPGGRLAITTWGPRLFEPLNKQFWDAVRVERPDLYKQFNPWDSVTEPEMLRALLAQAGITHADVVAERGSHPIATPSAWWTLVMGSGYRGTMEQLTPDARERVRAHNQRYIETQRVSEVETNVVFAICRRL